MFLPCLPRDYDHANTFSLLQFVSPPGFLILMNWLLDEGEKNWKTPVNVISMV